MATPVVRLGGITFGTADEDGDEFWVADIVGWTGVAPDVGLVELPVSDGAVVSYARQRARPLTIVGTAIAGPDGDVWRVRDKLESVCAAMVTANGTLEVDEPGETVSLAVRVIADPRVRPLGDIAIQFDIPLVAPNPAKSVVP